MSREVLQAILADVDALRLRVAAALEQIDAPAPERRKMAWGAKVSAVFRERILWTAEDLEIGTDPQDGADKLMTCIAWESGRSFRPDVKNMAGSGATGLIQFMPDTARGMGTTVEALAKETAEDQIKWVHKYFKPYKGRLKTLSDIYMAILWPAGVGKPEGFPLWERNKRPTTYRQNAGLDVNKDGTITKAEAASKVAALLPEGLRPGNAA